MASDAGQKIFAENNFEYPVKADVAIPEIVKSWGEFKSDSINLEEVGKLNSAAVKIFDKAGWK